jgi:glycosyltransferase involved in cell wall biosynthesis
MSFSMNEVASDLVKHFDAVVMATWSDWFTEMRSNRYHYASRFSRYLPVYFIQPDLSLLKCTFEKTELPNVTVLHAPGQYGPKQTKQIRKTLRKAGVKKPLLWVYNYYFDHLVTNYRSRFIVYHATEDYFSREFNPDMDSPKIDKLKTILAHTDLLVCASQGVLEDFLEKGTYTGAAAAVTNGCDFHFWAADDMNTGNAQGGRKVALYQGGISRKIDFSLLKNVIAGLPDWEFQFCGKMMLTSDQQQKEWDDILACGNASYLGCLPVEKMRDAMLDATVGLIPFVDEEWIVERAFPLKTFEYLACGLPVVSVPIHTLKGFSDLIVFADTPEHFIRGIQESLRTRNDPVMVSMRKRHASNQDYDGKFGTVSSLILSQLAEKDRKEKLWSRFLRNLSYRWRIFI